MLFKMHSLHGNHTGAFYHAQANTGQADAPVPFATVPFRFCKILKNSF